jgi:1,2-diacylglycerol 3-alpha-glucosyltransferase
VANATAFCLDVAGDNSAPTASRPPMTVAIVYHFLPHYRGGVFQQLLESDKYNYIFVAGHNNLAPSIPEWRPPDTLFVEARCNWIHKPWFYQKGLVAVALRKDIGAIIYLGAPYSISTWYSAILAQLTGKTVLFWTHGWLAKKGRLHDAIKKRFMCLADIILLYGERARTIGEGLGMSSDRMVVIYNSLDYAEQKRIREGIRDQDLIELRLRMFGDSNTPYAICTARLTRECDFDLLFSAQAILLKTNRIVNIVLVGDGPERKRLESLVRSESLPVFFVGACYDEAILAPLIRAANVTVSPGKIGLTAIHSLAYGTPVITHDDPDRQGPEVEAILPDSNGDLFRHGSAEDLARLLWKWCSRPWPDPALRANCHEVIERHYNPASQAQAIECALSRVAVRGAE